MLEVGDSYLLRDRYRIDALLGEGGMGTVYKAFDTLKNRFVAVKELRLTDIPADPDATIREDSTCQRNSRPVTRDQALKQFRKEADLLIGLTHENLPEIEDYFDLGEQGYFVMTLIEGRNLAQVVEEEHGPLPEETVRTWLKQIISALAYCHANQVIHRDVKPENLILTPQGKIYLVDFGIAKTMERKESSHTTIGARAFTEHYSPPEQRPGGRGTDERTDIFSLGAVLYFLLTGEAPEDVQMISSGETVRWPSRFNPQISPEMDNMIMRCMRLDKRERPQSIADVEALLVAKNFGVAEVEPSIRQFEQDRLLQAALKPERSSPFPEEKAIPVFPVRASFPEVRAHPAQPSSPPPPSISATPVLTPLKPDRSESSPASTRKPLSAAPTPVYPVRPRSADTVAPANSPAVSSVARSSIRSGLRPSSQKSKNGSRRWLLVIIAGLLMFILAAALLGMGLLGDMSSMRNALRQVKALGDRYEVMETYALIVDTPQGLLANDRDVDMSILSVGLSNGPAHGLLKLNTDGSFTYVPERGFTGTDTFSYQFVMRTSSGKTNYSESIPVVVNVSPLFRVWLPLVRK